MSFLCLKINLSWISFSYKIDLIKTLYEFKLKKNNKFDLKGYRMLHEATFLFKILLFHRYIFYLKSDLIETLYA